MEYGERGILYGTALMFIAAMVLFWTDKISFDSFTISFFLFSVVAAIINLTVEIKGRLK